MNWSIHVFDALCAACALVALSPLFVVIALAIKLESQGPVFFRQLRLGGNGETFSIFKFRTMVDGAESIGDKQLTSVGDARITRLGKLLRDWSLDELPQLINVVMGQMSLVGPRPALLEYLHTFDDRQIRRLDVPPGLTGWAQVNGRNSLTWPEKIEHDLWYVDHRSLATNIRIILRTIPVLISREGVYGDPANFDMLTRVLEAGTDGGGTTTSAAADSRRRVSVGV